MATNTTTTATTTEETDSSSNNYCGSLCQFCNNPAAWENKIFYKCGTILSKYFPISDNNPNPGWYSGTIRMHHVSSASDGEDEVAVEDEEEECIWNEIHYDDGDIENLPQDELKLLLVDHQVKILHSTTETTSPKPAENLSTSPAADDGSSNITPIMMTDQKLINNDKWLEKYDRLKKFKAENGHCRVPRNYGSDPQLGTWVNVQRRNYKNSTLSADRIDKLNDIGFYWVVHVRNNSDSTKKPTAQNWLDVFERLKKFKAENGHCRVPAIYNADPPLGLWVRQQRQRYKKTNPPMDDDCIEKLNAIGFDWVLRGRPTTTITDNISPRKPPAQNWQEGYEKLKKFKAENGHCRVPKRYSTDPSLGDWVVYQRARYKKKNMAADCIEKLNAIGFDWVVRDQNWLDMLERLKKFKAENGHCRVPRDYGPDLPLSSWVHWQRNLYSKSTLKADRVEKLNKIGFEWVVQPGINQTRRRSASNEKWLSGFAKLKEFKDKTGHCQVPNNYSEDPFLSNWVQTQRRNYKRKDQPMPTDQIEKLNSIGFEWVHQDERLKRIEQVCPKTGKVVAQYNSVKEGASAVGKFPGNISACLTVDPQKIVGGFRWRLYAGADADFHPTTVDGALTSKDDTPRKRKSDAFEDNLKALSEYKEKHGHCNVPQQSGGKLGRAVDNFRQEYKAFLNGMDVRGKPLKESKVATLQRRFERLQEAGLSFHALRAGGEQWADRVAELVAFKEANGHCDVKKRDGSLGRWVSNIRRRYKSRKRSELDRMWRERLNELDGIGFPWESTRSPGTKKGD